MQTSVLNNHVLVLNTTWKPIQVTTVDRAICLLYSGTAKVVDKDYQTYDFNSWCELSDYLEDITYVRTPNILIPAPDIILLSTYDKIPQKRRVKLTRKNLMLRDNGTCQYCNKKLHYDDVTMDHVLPRSKGGKTTWENIVIACVKCNRKKAARTPEEAHMHLITKPKRPGWGIIDPKLINKSSKITWNNFIDNIYWSVELVE